MAKLDRPTLAQHVEIGQAAKNLRNALDKFMNLTCMRKDGKVFLYAKEADKLCRLYNQGAVELIKSRLEDVMFADYKWLSNDAFGVYYHDDEKMTLYRLYKESGKEMPKPDDENASIPPWESLGAYTPPTFEDVLECADENDRWLDHFTDRVLDDLPFTAQESFWMDWMQHTHREIAEMARDALSARDGIGEE